jgi:CheY-like chemotaxis protein
MPSILIAEDDTASRELLTEYFNSVGWRVTAAADGAEAVKLAHECHPDIAVLDLRMPVMDGYEALRRLRSSADTADVPAIAVSAFATAQERSIGLKAGFEIYLTKPVDLAYLLEQAYCLVLPKGN